MQVRTLRTTDIAAVAEVEKIAWGESAATPATIAQRAAVFAPGSIVVMSGGEIVGYAASQLTGNISTGSWSDQTDDGQITQTHQSCGTLAYGVSMAARPCAAGKGVAYHVIEHYAKMYLGGGCHALCVGSRVPGFARWLGMNPGGRLDRYLTPAQGGRSRDPEVRLYNSGGFQVLWGLPDYYPDAKSAGHGAMMVRTRYA